MQMKKRLLIPFIILFAFVIRIIGLADFSLFWDEVFGLEWNTGHSIFEAIKLILNYDVRPPMYYLLLRPFLLLPTSVEFRIRILSVILGVLGIYVIYRSSKRIFDFKLAVIVTFLMSLSPMHYYHSQEARMYTLLFLVSSIFLGVWYEYLKTKSNKMLKWLIASSILGFYSHYYFVFPFFYAMIVTFIECFFKKEKIINFFRINIIVGIFISPLLIFAKASPFNSSFRAHLTEHAGWLIHADFNMLLENSRKLFFNYFYSYNSWAAYSFIFICIATGIIFSLKNKEFKKYIFFLGYATIPILLLFFGSILSESLFGSSFYEHRQSIFSLPAIVVLIAYPISKMNKYFTIISVLSVLFIYLQLDITYVEFKDRSFFEMRKYYNKNDLNKHDTWLSPYALYTVGEEYFDKSKTHPMTTDEYHTLSTEEIYTKIDMKIKKMDPHLLVWRDIGQLIGAGEREDLIAKYHLLNKYDFHTAEVYYCPHSASNDITLFRRHAKKTLKGIALIDFKFDDALSSLSYRIRGRENTKYLGIKKEYKLMLKTGNVYIFGSDIYRDYFKFFNPYYLLPPMYIRYPGDYTIHIDFPFWFSIWWIWIINLSWLLILISYISYIILSIKEFILKRRI